MSLRRVGGVAISITVGFGLVPLTSHLASSAPITDPAHQSFPAVARRTGSNGLLGVLRLAGGSGLTTLAGPACLRWEEHPETQRPALAIPFGGSISTARIGGIGLDDAVWTSTFQLIEFEGSEMVVTTSAEFSEDSMFQVSGGTGWEISTYTPELLVPVDDPAEWNRFLARIRLTYTATLPSGAEVSASDDHTFEARCDSPIYPPA